MLATRTSARTFGTCKASRSRATVRCNVFVKSDQMLAAVAAGALLLAPSPALASLPPGFKSPQGSEAAAIEARLDALIEQRTGKATPLPELNEVPKVIETKVEKAAPALPMVPPMAPAVMDPPPPPAAVAPAAVAPATVEAVAQEEAPARPAPAKATPAPAAVANEAPAPAKTGLQKRDAPAAAPAAGSNNGLLIGGGVAVLGVVAAAALAGNNGSAEQTSAAAAAAPAAPAVDASPVEGAAAEAAPAGSEGAPTSN